MQAYATTSDVPEFAVFDDPDHYEVEQVVALMREQDRAEFAAWSVDHKAAGTIIEGCDYKWVVYHYEQPVFVFGLRQFLPGAHYLVGFGSALLEKCTLRAFSKWALRVWLPYVFESLKAHRIEAVVPVQSRHSINWLTRMGGTVECSKRNYATPGDRFVSLAYTISDFEKDYSEYVSVQCSPAASRTSHAHEDQRANAE